MENKIQLFTNETFGNIRAINIKNEVWFFGKDVVISLGYDLTNTTYGKYIERHCDSDDYLFINKENSCCFGIETKENSGNECFNYKLLGQRGGYVINQYALIDLALKSTKPEAKKFRHWVTHEVIPSVLNTGFYSIEQSERFEQLEDMVKQLQACLNKPKLSPIEELKEKLESNKSERQQVILLHQFMLENKGISMDDIKKYQLKMYVFKYDRLCRSESDFMTINRKIRNGLLYRVLDEPDFLE